MITLKTLPEATAQQVYDQVKAHLLQQGQHSANETTCMYLNPEGLKCAAGCLIAADEYTKEFEGHNWRTLVERNRVPATHYLLIRKLQAIHDSDEPADWPEQLRRIAEEFGLTP